MDSGLCFGRPDDLIIEIADTTATIIDGVEWLKIFISPAIRINSRDDVYVAVDKVSAVFTSTQSVNNTVAMEIYETFPYTSGNKIVYFESIAEIFLLGRYGQQPRINFYKLSQTNAQKPANEFSELHFRFILGRYKIPITRANFTNLVITFQFSKTAPIDKYNPESARPGHSRGVKRIAPVNH